MVQPGTERQQNSRTNQQEIRKEGVRETKKKLKNFHPPIWIWIKEHFSYNKK
jgi:hypothetical protein